LDTSRTICAVADSRGLGDGAFIATLRLGARVDRASFLRAVRGDVIAALLDQPSIVAVHLLEGQGGVDGGPSAEKALRGQPDQTADWILLIEAADAPPLEDVLAGPASARALAAAGARYDEVRDCGIYRLQSGVSHDQLA
ncbi:MAG TPA: hypothetical protein VHN20_15195, partial [Beijerinckiaceae bacterium]|nr:hypothetical protein [Beijerinckiaceae bacterium]